MKRSFQLLATFLALGLAQLTFAAKFYPPEQALERMTKPEGFDVGLYAAEPDIREPIAFTFDTRGRIWVLENGNYKSRGSHLDGEKTRIQILEDTDGDGTFDKKKLFTDKLTFSSGILVGAGGVYVGTPPYLQFIPDKNGDDVPDGPPEILLDGWGINDRHETLNSFLWGPDGWLYGCHGVFTRSNVGKPGTLKEDRQFIDGGIWRFHPIKKTFEVFAEGLSNPWGFDFNDEGQGFATCCVIPHLFHIIQGGAYHKQSRQNVNPHVYNNIKTIRDHTHRSAHGGARFYLADTFPEKYRDQLFMCNIHQHQVLTDIMERKGSGYVGKHGEDFLTANDQAWVGFSVEVGPDGAVYILDWHDSDICGTAVNYPNTGRIYRIQAEGAPKRGPFNLAKRSDLELAKMQSHPNDWYVRYARVLLQARMAAGTLDHKSVHKELQQQFKKASDSGRRLRALWALHVTEGLDTYALLNHEDEYVRAWCIQLLCEDKNPDKSHVDRFAKMAAKDPSPVVRLYLAAALQRMPHEQRWPIIEPLVQHAEDEADQNISRLIWLGLEPMVPDQMQRALNVASAGELSMVQKHVARRMLSTGISQKKPVIAKYAPQPNVMKHLARIAPGFNVKDVGERGVVYHEVLRNREAIQTHPSDKQKPCVLYRDVDIPKGKQTTLNMVVSHHPHGDWMLKVRAGGTLLAQRLISSKTVKEEWLEIEYDLSDFAGTRIRVDLENAANDWHHEWGYWGSIKITSNNNQSAGKRK